MHDSILILQFLVIEMGYRGLSRNLDQLFRVIDILMTIDSFDIVSVLRLESTQATKELMIPIT